MPSFDSEIESWGELEKLRQTASVGIFGANSTESNREQNGIIGRQIWGAWRAMTLWVPLIQSHWTRTATHDRLIAIREGAHDFMTNWWKMLLISDAASHNPEAAASCQHPGGQISTSHVSGCQVFIPRNEASRQTRSPMPPERSTTRSCFRFSSTFQKYRAVSFKWKAVRQAAQTKGQPPGRPAGGV